MLEIIMLSALWYFGFWCGKKFGSLKAAYTAARNKIEAFFA